MRIIDILTPRSGSWRTEAKRVYIRARNKYLGGEQLRPGHRYRDMITGEEVTIQSVGSQVELKRHGTETPGVSSLPKANAQLALDVGVLNHSKRRCPRCPR